MRALSPAAVLTLGIAFPAFARADATIALDGPADVRGLEVLDLDGDGVNDLLLLGGRELRGWRGKKGGSPDGKPTWTWTVPPTATFVSPGTTYGDGVEKTPSLVALAGSQALRLLPGKPPIVEEGLAVVLPWTDARRANLSLFARGGALFLPTDAGYRWLPDWTKDRRRAFDVPLPPRRRVTPAGPFLEDSAVVSFSWPAPTIARGLASLGGKDAAFFVGTDGIHAFVPDGAHLVDLRYALDFLPSQGRADRRQVLVDLDGDKVPDLAQETTTNLTGEYLFFRTPPPVLPEKRSEPSRPEAGGDLRPARGLIRLTGFQLPPDYVDLDGDGRLDFVVTTIEIDGTNVIGAVMQGRVTARTRAFLNRARKPTDDFFAATPDVERPSEVGIKIRFGYTGSIDVTRSFTIVAKADLDGDRRKDLLIRTGPDEMTAWPSTASGVWAGEERTISIPVLGASPDLEAYVGDLSADGKDDLVLLYRAPPGGSDRTTVRISP